MIFSTVHSNIQSTYAAVNSQYDGADVYATTKSHSSMSISSYCPDDNEHIAFNHSWGYATSVGDNYSNIDRRTQLTNVAIYRDG